MHTKIFSPQHTHQNINLCAQFSYPHVGCLIPLSMLVIDTQSIHLHTIPTQQQFLPQPPRWVQETKNLTDVTMTRLGSQSSVVQEALGKPFEGRPGFLGGCPTRQYVITCWGIRRWCLVNLIFPSRHMEPPHWSKKIDRYGVGIVCRSYYLVVLYFSIENKLLVVFSVHARWPIHLKGVFLQTMWRTAAPKGSPCLCPSPPYFPITKSTTLQFFGSS